MGRAIGNINEIFGRVDMILRHGRICRELPEVRIRWLIRGWFTDTGVSRRMSSLSDVTHASEFNTVKLFVQFTVGPDTPVGIRKERGGRT